MDSVRVGFIGIGGRGKGHIRIVNEFDDVELVAVCDLIPDNRDAVADEYDIPGRFDDLNVMFDEAHLDHGGPAVGEAVDLDLDVLRECCR